MTSTMNIGNANINMNGMDDDTSKLLTEIYGSITHVEITNPAIFNMFNDSFPPYLEEKKAYDECAKDFKQKMDIYVAE